MKPPHVTLLLITLSIIGFNPSDGQTLPSGFTALQVVTGISKPVGMAFAPDGRIFVLEQNGAVRVIKDGVLLPTPLIRLKVDGRGEGGLIGIALDPTFSMNQYFYLYYSVPEGARDRISRFKCNGDLAALSTEQIILDLDTRTALVHHGGAMLFRGGKLFVAIGDDANGANAQNLDAYHGKIIRINPDGSIPLSNPYPSGSEQRRRTWAYGMRNPFTFAVQPGTGKIFVNDVGLERWEEINDATLPGKNFGWPEAEGASTNPAFTNSVFAYEHGRLDEFGCAIAGGTFFNPVQTSYPAAYVGRYFFQDYCGQWIKTLNISTSPARVEPFATGMGADALYLTMGNDGNLYYLTRSTGSLFKIIYSSEEAPQILKQPASLSVSVGQPASFSVTASGKSPLMYQWRKNGVAITGATASAFTITQTTSSHAGSYSVRVSNALGSVISDAAQLTVTAANHRPVAQILQPAAGVLYRGGDTISFSGTATDEEDGELAPAKFTWMADFHHDTHRHDGPPVASGAKSGSFTIPTRGETSDNVWYRLYLIVTDSQGSADTASVNIYPRKSTIKLATEPAGMKVTIDGQPLDAPISIVSVENIERSIGAVTPQQFSGKTFTFQKWLHGGAGTQTIYTPVEDVTYTAVFAETTTSLTRREIWNGIPGSHISSIPLTSPPDQIAELENFESPTNIGDAYGSRIRAYILPPSSGNYVFWISGNDRTELWLSTDENPANKRRIAYTDGYTYVREWTRYPTQQSVPIALGANQKYYIEALHKELEGSDHVAVGWQLPGGTLERPVPRIRLSSYPGPNKAPVVDITSPPHNGSFSAPASVSIAATASDSDGIIARVEFYNSNAKLGEDLTAPYTFSWTGVSAGSYTLTAKAMDNNGSTSSASVDIVVTGAITHEVWLDIPGSRISYIPQDSEPSSTGTLKIFEAPTNTGDFYGRRIRGFIYPPTSGNYVFWISGNDRTELWLSTDENPANKKKIAYTDGYTFVREWNKYPTQQSTPIALAARRKYYVEALHKELEGSDHVAVGWQLPGGTFQRPIPGIRLLPVPAAAQQAIAGNTTQTWSSLTVAQHLIAEETEQVESGIDIYPNPVSIGKTELILPEFEDPGNNFQTKIHIRGITGKIVYSVSYISDAYVRQYSIPLDELAPGVYLVTVTSNNRSFSKRLTIR
jgi:glucose/arabinose dehydrogenase